MNQEERAPFGQMPCDAFAPGPEPYAVGGESDIYGLPDMPRVQWKPREDDDDMPWRAPRGEAVLPVPPPIVPMPPMACPPCKEHHPLCALDLPYPPARADSRSPAAIRAVQTAYAGCASEVSAVMQYIYDALIFSSCCAEASDTLRCIAMCEMKHVWLLGEVLTSMGCDPKYRAPTESGNGWWNAGPAHLRYPVRLEAALLEAISGERQGIDFYTRMIKTLDDDAICLLVRRIIMDEEQHIKLLTSLYERFCK